MNSLWCMPCKCIYSTVTESIVMIYEPYSRNACPTHDTIYHKLVLAKGKALFCIFGKKVISVTSLGLRTLRLRTTSAPLGLWSTEYWHFGAKLDASASNHNSCSYVLSVSICVFETNQGCFCACVCLFTRLSVCLSKYFSATALNWGKK